MRFLLFFTVMKKNHSFLVFLFFFLFTPSAIYPELNDEQRGMINQCLDAAYSAYVKDDYEKAYMNFRNVLQMDPQDETALRGFKRCGKKLEKKLKERKKRVKTIRKFVRQEKWIEAIDMLYEFMEKNPGMPDAVEIQNSIAATFQKSISEAEPGTPHQMICQGFSFYLVKKYDEALRVWKEASGMLKDDAKVKRYVAKAEEMFKKGMVDEMTDKKNRQE